MILPVARRPPLRVLLPSFVFAWLLVAGPGSAGEVRRPSILLFVSDTTRADAIHPGSAPTVVALAADGVRYTNAFSQAPWTLPSHASLFSGMLPTEHGVGVRSLRAPDELEMLAERLGELGYRTMGISENPWVSEDFNMDQGFDEFRFVRDRSHDGFLGALDQLLSSAEDDRPSFLFVNVMDAHQPYRSTENDPFTPPFLDAKQVNEAARRAEESLCRADADPRDQAIAWSLYQGGIARGDQKLASVLAALRQRAPDRDWITIFTSDHGQHFGEHGLTDHLFSLHQELLHVPLVVDGAPGAPPPEVTGAVSLDDLADTIVAWASGSDEALPERGSRPIVSELTEFSSLAKYDNALGRLAETRASCDRARPIFGDMRSLIQYPMKLIWYSDYPAALFDLSKDPGEKVDLSRVQTERTRLMSIDLASSPSAGRVAPPRRRAAEPNPDVVRRLRELGYVADSAPQSAGSASVD